MCIFFVHYLTLIHNNYSCTISTIHKYTIRITHANKESYLIILYNILLLYYIYDIMKILYCGVLWR